MDDERYYFRVQLDEDGDEVMSDNSGYFSADPNQRLLFEAPQPSHEYGHVDTLQPSHEYSHFDAPQPSHEYSDIPLIPSNNIPLLPLSGRVISVTFTIPYSIRAPGDQGQEWEVSIRSRMEHSVQFDILSHLSSAKCPQHHIVIGWTGEISSPDATHSRADDPSPRLSNDANSLAQPRDNLFVSCHNQQVLDQQLASAELRRFVDDFLFPLFHEGRSTEMTITKGENGWCDYLGLMDAFADKLCDLWQPGDIVMVHDYALMLLPRILRARLPHIHLTFSLHASCPSHIPPGTNMRLLSKVLQGPFGADLLTFQAFIHSDQFLGWCAQEAPAWAPHQDFLLGRVADLCFVHPMAIDASRVTSLASSEEVSQICDSLKSAFEDKKIIVSYSTPGFNEETAYVTQAFDRLETLFPRWRGKVVMLQITSLPWLYRDEGASESGETLVDTLAAQNSSKKSFKDQLVETEHYALLRASDATIFPFAPEALIKAGLDFMLCQRGSNKRPVISETSPLRFQLPRAILFPRGDVDGIAKALDRALECPECSNRPSMTPHRVLEPLMIPTVEEWDSTERGETRPNGGDEGDGNESDDTLRNMDDSSDFWDSDESWPDDSGYGSDGEDSDSTSRTTPEPDDGDEENAEGLINVLYRAQSEPVQSTRQMLSRRMLPRYSCG
ncbi:glycosyltransferase family 20 domain-containing protein [Trichoderma breve]|uniref:Glycosyltransferase family 20 domain-containing protein n=1 Tax=Trichoderma breve TaxID=2034170 RepID=A0A9W9B7Z3_9HYPO|nr:glycosyltransferase family 20 domain-containing protein [Trichoderma breve]KAJ4858293.1 glycosyltransferase family 20 domain-containing protein [Trichoderma breve]